MTWTSTSLMGRGLANVFGRVVKNVRLWMSFMDGLLCHPVCCFILSCMTVMSVVLSVCPVLFCPVCNVGVLWPKGWTDQDETWHAGRPRPRPHCVRLGTSSPPLKGTPPILSPHLLCQTAGWINMPLGMQVGLGPGDFVLDGNPTPPPPKFRPISIVPKRLDVSRCHLVWR